VEADAAPLLCWQISHGGSQVEVEGFKLRRIWRSHGSEKL
jgi:hypothetical protein